MAEMRKNIDSLDLIKGIAAILIVFHHYQQVFSVTFNGVNFYGGRLSFGYLVELFFMVSGYLTIYTAKRNNCVPFVKNLTGGGCALIHKLLRIYPMTTITIMFCLSVKTIDAWYIGDAAKLSELWNVKALVANFLLLFRGWPGLSMMGYDNPMWYLCILIQCYLVFYIVRIACEWLGRKVRWSEEVIEIAAWILVIILVTLLRNIVAYDTYRGLQAFGIGVVLCPTFNWIAKKIENRRSIKKRGFTILLCFIAAGTITLTCWHSFLQREVLIAGAFIPILAIAFIYREWESDKARLPGKTSFEVFIWHAPMMAFAELISHLTGAESFPIVT